MGDLRVLWGPLLPASEVDSWQLHSAPVFFYCFFLSFKRCETESAAGKCVILQREKALDVATSLGDPALII